jgi:DNA repair protein RecN (Recombination protein N)
VLTLLKIERFALIDELTMEFGGGLNLLTGETGSGKSIIVDSLGALTGDRVSTDLIKQGENSARIEGAFAVQETAELDAVLDEAGIDGENGELIVRREISHAGKNRIFINNQLTTQAVLRRVGALLVDIHGQGDQATLYDRGSHARMLDDFAAHDALLARVGRAYAEWLQVKAELDSLEADEAEKLQLVDVLRFQVSEILRIGPSLGEDDELEEEKRRVANAEKLSTLSDDAYKVLYEDGESTLTTLDRGVKSLNELAEYDSSFAGYKEGLETARAVIEDAAFHARDFRSRLDFSPERLDEIETRLAELTSLKRKYGGTIEAVLKHLESSQQRLGNMESSELREAELRQDLKAKHTEYLEAARKLHDSRVKAARKFASAVEKALSDVALDKARFEVKVDPDESAFSTRGIDAIEFHFSANPGEPPRPLARVASGGEASRLMLTLKTAAKSNERGKAAVFDEVDIGIGGRVAEAVGRKLKNLAETQQVLCVTHQPQIASLADEHFVVEKTTSGKKTSVAVRQLSSAERIEEIARMLAGEQVTEAARENARAMLAGAK